MNFSTLIHDFHFVRPMWLIALPLLWLLVFWLARSRNLDGDWSQCIDAALLPALQIEAASKAGVRPWPWLTLLWTLTVLALAGPSWERIQTPAFRAPADWIFILDLSPSMAATDVAPNRYTRARYALDDLLNTAHDARVGLVAFSDEPFTVTPLTQDIATVSSLLPALAPNIMPSQGNHLAPAFTQAENLLRVAASKDQTIVVFSDGFDDPAAAFSAAAKLHGSGVTISVVGIGTASGAPLQTVDGHFAKDTQGQSQVTKLNADQLQQLAQSGGGLYVDVAQLPRLIAYLQSKPRTTGNAIEAKGIEVAHWRDEGVWLLPLLLLLASVLARRSWL